MPKKQVSIIWLILAGDVVASGIAMLAGGERPSSYFGEGDPITWLNAIQLAACAVLGWGIFRVRAQQDRRAAGFWLWTLWGASFLTLDELLSFHETHGLVLEFVRHGLELPLGSNLKIGGTPILSYGDVLQILYAVPVLSVCWFYRRELLREREALAFFGLGATLLAISLYFDAVPMYDRPLLFGLTLSHTWLKAFEKSFKLTGFGAILGGFLETWRGCLASSKQISRSEPTEVVTRWADQSYHEMDRPELSRNGLSGTEKAESKHSGLGIASFIISIIGGIGSIVVLVVAGYYETVTPGGMLVAMIVGVFLFAIFLLLVGTGLGIAGLFQKDNKRIFAILGTILNSAFLILVIAVVVLGLE